MRKTLEEGRRVEWIERRKEGRQEWTQVGKGRGKGEKRGWRQKTADPREPLNYIPVMFLVL